MITDEDKKIQKLQKARRKCNFNDRESIDSYVSKVDKVAQKLIKARKFDAAMHLLTQVQGDLQKCQKAYPALQLVVQVTRAELFNQKMDRQNELAELKVAYRLSQQNKACKKIKQAEILLNLAQAANSIGHKFESLQYSEEACSTIQNYKPESDKDFLNQADLLVQATVICGGFLERDSQSCEALEKFKFAQSVLKEHFPDSHPQVRRVQEAIQRLEPKALELYHYKQFVKNKEGRVVRSYLQVTDEVQNQDQREEIPEPDTHLNVGLNKVDSCLVNTGERHFQMQLLAMRQFQDEKFRIEQLLLSNKSLPCAPKPAKLPKPAVWRPERASSTSSSSSSSSSQSSSQKSSEKPRTPSSKQSSSSSSSSSDEEQDWVTTYPFPDETLVDVKLESTQVEKTSQTFTLAPDAAAITTCGTKYLLTEKHFKNDYHKAVDSAIDPRIIIFIQSRIRRFLAWIKLKRIKEQENILIRFYVKWTVQVVRVTVQRVLMKATKIEKHYRADKKDNVLDVNEEIKSQKLIEGYSIECCNRDNLAQRFLMPVKEKMMPPRRFLAQYLTAALSFIWDGPVFIKFNLRQLSQEEIDDITLEQQMLIENLKLKFAQGVIDQQKAKQIDRNSKIATQKSLGFSGSASQLTAGVVTQELRDKLRKEACFVATTSLGKDQMRTKIEWQARQIISKGPTSRKIFRLVEDSKSDSQIKVKTIKLNTQMNSGGYVPTFATLAPKMDVKKIAKVQAMVRGWLTRRKHPSSSKDSTLVGCFTMEVQSIFVQIKVYQITRRKVIITAQQLKTKTEVITKEYDNLPTNITSALSIIKHNFQAKILSDKLADFEIDFDSQAYPQTDDQTDPQQDKSDLSDDSDSQPIIAADQSSDDGQPVTNADGKPPSNDDINAHFIRRLITLGNPKKLKFSFEITRHDIEYLGRYLKYRGKKIIVVWRRDNIADADYIVLQGNQKLDEDDLDEPCCMDTLCTGCAKCIGASCFCMACVDKKHQQKSCCPLAKMKCVKRVAKVYYNEQNASVLSKMAIEEEKKAKEIKMHKFRLAQLEKRKQQAKSEAEREQLVRKEQLAQKRMKIIEAQQLKLSRERKIGNRIIQEEPLLSQKNQNSETVSLEKSETIIFENQQIRVPKPLADLPNHDGQPFEISEANKRKQREPLPQIVTHKKQSVREKQVESQKKSNDNESSSSSSSDEGSNCKKKCGKCAKCVTKCPKTTMKALCKPCKACSKCLDCTGAIVCGCVDGCESCARKIGSTICDCTSTACRFLFCTIPQKTGECLCLCAQKVGQCAIKAGKGIKSCVSQSSSAISRCVCKTTKCMGECVCKAAQATGKCVCSAAKGTANCICGGAKQLGSCVTNCAQCGKASCAATAQKCASCGKAGCSSIGDCFKNMGLCVLGCPAATCKCIVNCPRNTITGCNKCTKRKLNCFKRQQDKVCAFCTKACRKRQMKCCKALFCICLCKVCLKKKKDSSSSDDESKMEIVLKKKELKDFFVENLLIFRNEDNIGYIALDNKDRLYKPGHTLILFSFTHAKLDYMVRLLVYRQAQMPLALTVHRTGDTTDCSKLSWSRSDVYISGQALEQFLRQNLVIKLMDDLSERIKSISLLNDRGLFESYFDDRLVKLVQAQVRMYFTRKRYLMFMQDKVCVYYDRVNNNVAKVTVYLVMVKKTKTERHVTERLEHKGSNTEVDKNVDTKVTSVEVQAYKIIVQNKRDESNLIEKVVLDPLPKHPIDYLKLALKVEWDSKDLIQKVKFRVLSQNEIEGIQLRNKSYLARIKQDIKVSWMHIKSYTPQPGHTVILCTAEVSQSKEPYLQIVYKTQKRRYVKTLTLLELARIMKHNTKMPFTALLQKCNFVENIEAYESLLKSFQVDEQRDELVFLWARYNELRFGFNVRAVKSRMTEVEAARIITRAAKRWLRRRLAKQARRKHGFLSLSGVSHHAGHCLVYVMLADRQQKNFTMTVKDKNQGIILLNKHKIQPQTLKSLKGFTYPLEGVEKELLKIVESHSDLKAIQAAIQKL